MVVYSANQYLVDWFSETGLSPTPRVVINTQDHIDTTNNWARVSIHNRDTTETDLIGPGESINGTTTQRAKVDTGGYRENLIYLYATSAAGSPVIHVRFYVSGDETLDATDSTLDDDWIEILFPEYIGTDPTFATAYVSDGTNPSADIMTAVTPVLYRGLGYQLLVADTAVSAGLEDTDATDLTPVWSFAANGGGVWPLINDPQHYYWQTSAGKAVQVAKSNANTVHASIQYRSNPLRLTAATEACLRLPPAKAIAVEITSATATGNSLSLHVRHSGLM